ncbi:MAG: LamG-like jellyroll fold domain-containing protein [Kofleriaceae bacterium]
MSAKHLLRTIIIAFVALAGCLADTPLEGSTEQAVAPVPQNLTGMATSATRIDLSWSPIVPQPTSYIIMRGPTPSTLVNISSAPANKTTYANGRILPGETTCWAVRSVVAGEVSDPSNVICLTTPGAPSAPPNVTAIALSSSRIEISWDPVVGAQRYYVTQADSLAGPYTLIGSPTATTFVATGLAPSTTYFYRVQTQFEGGTSMPSDPPASATTFALGDAGYWRFDEEMGSVANDSSGFGRHGTLTGSAAFTNTKPPIDFNKSALLSPGGANDAVNVPHNAVFNFGGDFTFALWANIPSAPATTIRLAGKRASGCGATTTWELIQGPGGLQMRSSLSTASFGQSLPGGQWTHVAVAREAGLLHMYINGLEVAAAPFTSGAQVLSPMQFGNSGGCGANAALLLDDVKIFSRALSAGEVGVIGTRPPAPLNLVVTAISPTRVHVTWDPVPGATKYIMYKGTGPGTAVFFTSTSADDTEFDDGHLTPSQTTTWQVAAVVNSLISERSNEDTATTFPPPLPPSDVTAVAASRNRINLAWTAVPNASKYYVYQSTGGGAFTFKGTVLAGPAPTFAASGLAANTTYTYVVRTVANDTTTESVNSAPASATTLP